MASADVEVDAVADGGAVVDKGDAIVQVISLISMIFPDLPPRIQL